MYQKLASQTFSIWLIQLVLVIIPLIDAYFLMGISSKNFAAYALANSFYSWWILSCKGVLQGIVFATALYFGQKKYIEVYQLLLQSFWLLGLLVLVAWAMLGLSAFGIAQAPISLDTQRLAIQYLQVSAFGVPAVLGIRILAGWLEGISQPLTMTIWLWFGLIIKTILTVWLLSGYWGERWQNLTGCALATNIMYWGIFVGLLIKIRYNFPKQLARLNGSTAQRLNGSTAQRLNGSTAQRLLFSIFF